MIFLYKKKLSNRVVYKFEGLHATRLMKTKLCKFSYMFIYREFMNKYLHKKKSFQSKMKFVLLQKEEPK